MNSGLNFVVADTMKDAADKVVARREASVTSYNGRNARGIHLWQSWLINRRA
jgi:hypothetical protein